MKKKPSKDTAIRNERFVNIRDNHTFTEGDSGRSISGICPFDLAGQELLLNRFSASCAETVLQFLAFTFLRGTITGAVVYDIIQKEKKMNIDRDYLCGTHEPKMRMKEQITPLK